MRRFGNLLQQAPTPLRLRPRELIAIGDVTEQTFGLGQVSQLFFSATPEEPGNDSTNCESSKEEPFGDGQADESEYKKGNRNQDTCGFRIHLHGAEGARMPLAALIFHAPIVPPLKPKSDCLPLIGGHGVEQRPQIREVSSRYLGGLQPSWEDPPGGAYSSRP